MKKKNRWVIFLIAAVVAAVSGYFSQNDNATENASVNKHLEIFEEKDALRVHFLDVGQGDCAVIELPNGEVIMIDAGENGNENVIFDFLDENEISKIDYLVATHPHSDHIGGMPEVISEYDIGEIYMPNVTHTSKTFSDTVNAIDKKGLSVNIASKGKELFNYGGLSAKLLSPIGDEYENLNNYSAVLRLDYIDTSFLFCGDIEKEVENELIISDEYLGADVMKLPHHGSSTSSTIEFLQTVSPDISVISCGKDNEYGHPHSEVLERINKISNKVYRTDTNGTVSVITDGHDIEVSCELN